MILKAHTRNHAGTVTLKNSDPLEPPIIDFNQFAEGGEQDVQAVVDGIQFVRGLNDRVHEKGIAGSEVLPGRRVQDEELQAYVRQHAWGHHACGPCANGPVEEGGVLTSDFPRIPGFFIASAVYLIAEKAADVILSEAC